MEKNTNLPQMPHADKQINETQRVGTEQDNSQPGNDPRQQAIENETDTKRLRSEQQSTKEGGKDA